MKDALFIDSFSSLPAKEQQLFLRFVDSPYFNTDKKLVTLLQWIMTQAPGQLDRAHADAFLFPGETFQYDRITNHISYLQRLLERFLAQEEWQRHSRQPLLWGIKASQRRGMSRLFSRLVGKWDRLSDKGRPVETEDLVDQQEVVFQRNQQMMRLGLRESDRSLVERARLLRDCAMLARLSNTCQWLTLSQVLTIEEADQALMEQEIEELKTQSAAFTDHPHILLYRHILLMLLHPEEDGNYRTFRSLLHQFTGVDADRRTLFQYAQNYCIQRINRGNQDYLPELFVLYQDMLERGLLYEEGEISGSDVKNIVSLGVRLKEFAWTESFLTKTAPHVPADQQEISLQYNRAYLLEAMGEAREAMRMLAGVEFPDIFYQLGARVILIKCYYRLRDLEGLESAIHSFAGWLRRNRQVSAYQRKVHLNLLRFTRKLAMLRARLQLFSHTEQQRQLDLLGKQIRQTAEITNISWVLEQVEGLRGKLPG
ncbi:MAG: hypothetical protein NWR72_02345 [Bacteroidia bacterium]|nr:hypothetical protein [Bacteroidia bacterium]